MKEDLPEIKAFIACAKVVAGLGYFMLLGINLVDGLLEWYCVHNS